MKKIAFISSALQQPRHQKRIDLLRNKYDVTVLYFYRNKYIENYKHYVNNATKIGKVKDGRYFSRIFLLIKLFFILFRSDAKIIYCTSIDQAFVSLLTFKKVLFEVGDLYQVDGKNKLYKILDFIIMPRISGLIITSPYFSDYYNRFNLFLKNKLIVIENKLPPEFLEKISEYRGKYFSSPPNVTNHIALSQKLIYSDCSLPPYPMYERNHDSLKGKAGEHNRNNLNFKSSELLVAANKTNHIYPSHQSRPIKLGLIGASTFVFSLNNIRDFIKNNTHFELHIFGNDLSYIFKGLNNVIYHGPFKSPEELPSIYSCIEINIILYDSDNNNVKLALPNKLYESIAFLRPIICSDNVALTEIVRKYSLGEVVVNNNIGLAINKILSNYKEYIDNILALNESTYICYEQTRIIDLIDNLQ